MYRYTYNRDGFGELDGITSVCKRGLHSRKCCWLTHLSHSSPHGLALGHPEKLCAQKTHICLPYVSHMKEPYSTAKAVLFYI